MASKKSAKIIAYLSKHTIFTKMVMALIVISIVGGIIYGIIHLSKSHSHNSNSNSNSTNKPISTFGSIFAYMPGSTGSNTSGLSTFPDGKIKAAWSSVIGCGEGEFDIISLASALPSKYSDSYKEFFTATINGSYNKNISTRSKTKYLISVGGSNASPTGWASFIAKLSTSNGASDFLKACACYGVVGIDWDLEGTTVDMVPKIISINRALKAINNDFIIVLTVLLGVPDIFAPMLSEHDTYDYLALMLYNGGMYKADVTGAGCDWDGWAELICSKGTAGCGTPLMLTREEYAKQANLSNIDPTKVLLGLIIDTTGPRLTQQVQDRANDIINKYDAAGVFIWVLPGWATTDSIAKLKEIGYSNLGECSTSAGCPPPEKPCVDGTPCVATSCAKSSQGVTDEQCAPCPGQSWWPCNVPGFCSQPVPVDTDCKAYK